ncbi:unnamed protein product [Rotaria sp. Silwood2]|nr:unnamed protein product [Rotaria sp. Silwood2]
MCMINEIELLDWSFYSPEFNIPLYVQSLGSLIRKSKQRVSSLNVDNESRILACYVCQFFNMINTIVIELYSFFEGVESFGEFFRILTVDEVRTSEQKYK